MSAKDSGDSGVESEPTSLLPADQLKRGILYKKVHASLDPVDENTDIASGRLVPVPKAWYNRIPGKEGPPGIDPGTLFTYCGFKVLTGGLMGSVVGIGMGMFLGAMNNDVQTVQMAHGREIPQAPLREQMRQAVKALGGKTRGWAKSFGILTALFEGIECVIEKYRGKHDVWNQVTSGCIVGATLSISGGPGAAAAGCAGFGGFSLLIDRIMGPH